MILLIKIKLKKQTGYQLQQFQSSFIKIKKLFYLIVVQPLPIQNYLRFLLENHYFLHHFTVYFFVTTQLMIALIATVFAMKIYSHIACIFAGWENKMVNEITTTIITLFQQINSIANYLSNWFSNFLEKNLITIIINFLCLY